MLIGLLGLRNGLQHSMINEPSVFKPSRFDYTSIYVSTNKAFRKFNNHFTFVFFIMFEIKYLNFVYRDRYMVLISDAK